MNEPAINESLRAHVTRVGFDLSLARSHIAALVWLDFVIRTDKGGPMHALGRPLGIRRAVTRGHPLERAFGHFVGGVHGLQDRGLVVHTHPDTITLPRGWDRRRVHELPARRIWRITPAGRLVIALLKESGVWQEYAEALLLPEVRAAS